MEPGTVSKKDLKPETDEQTALAAAVITKEDEKIIEKVEENEAAKAVKAISENSKINRYEETQYEPLEELGDPFTLKKRQIEKLPPSFTKDD